MPYVHERKQFGQAIGEFQLMQGKLADMYTTMNAAAPMSMRWREPATAAQTTRKDAAGAILYAAEKATWMALEAIQCLGGNGYINDYPTGRLLRDAKLYEIGAGTSEIRRMLIGRELFARDRMTRPSLRRSTRAARTSPPMPPRWRALVADLRARVGRRRAGRRRRGARSGTSRAASCCRASASRRCSIPARRSSNSRSSPPTACTATRCPSAGIITGIGRVSGRECVIVANDATVKGGTYYPITVKKHLRAQEIARAEPPALHLSGRFRRRLPAEAGRGLPRPRAFRPHLLQPGQPVGRRASRRSPWCMGSCTAGGAYVPAMCDESIIVRNQGTIFLGGPPLVKAATGEVVTRRGPGRRRRARPHLRAWPTTTRRTTATRWRSCRRIVAGLNHVKQPRRRAARAASRRATIRPSCYGVVPADLRAPYDVREVIARIVDGSRVRRVQAALRHHAGLRLRAHLGLSGRHPRQQRHPVLRSRR